MSAGRRQARPLRAPDEERGPNPALQRADAAAEGGLRDVAGVGSTVSGSGRCTRQATVQRLSPTRWVFEDAGVSRASNSVSWLMRSMLGLSNGATPADAVAILCSGMAIVGSKNL